MKFEFARKRDRSNFWRKSKMKLNCKSITNENLMKTSFFFSLKFRWRWDFCSFCFWKKKFFRKSLHEKKTNRDFVFVDKRSRRNFWIDFFSNFTNLKWKCFEIFFAFVFFAQFENFRNFNFCRFDFFLKLVVRFCFVQFRFRFVRVCFRFVRVCFRFARFRNFERICFR